MTTGGSIPKTPTGNVETFEVTSRVVACDGGGGPLGHPRVYLRIPDRDTFCPYCSRHFMLREGAGDDGH